MDKEDTQVAHTTISDYLHRYRGLLSRVHTSDHGLDVDRVHDGWGLAINSLVCLGLARFERLGLSI